jgi:hypothetical protein
MRPGCSRRSASNDDSAIPPLNRRNSPSRSNRVEPMREPDSYCHPQGGGPETESYRLAPVYRLYGWTDSGSLTPSRDRYTAWAASSCNFGPQRLPLRSLARRLALSIDSDWSSTESTPTTPTSEIANYRWATSIHRTANAGPLHGKWHSPHPAVCRSSSIRCRQGRANSTSAWQRTHENPRSSAS